MTTMTTKQAVYEKWQAGYPAVYIHSFETPLIYQDIREVAKNRKRRCFVWDLVDGLFEDPLKAGEPLKSCNGESTGTPVDVLSYMHDSLPNNSVVVLKDFHHFLKDPMVQALMKKLMTPFKQSQRMIVILSPILSIPEELKKEIALIDTSLPGAAELEIVLKGVCQGAGTDVPDPATVRLLVDAARGLTTTEAESAFALSFLRPASLQSGKTWDPVVVLDEKCLSLKKDGLLEYLPPGIETMESLGGMDLLKEWITRRKDGFTDAAREFGCRTPAGILLVGIPGTGKSLGAKVTAAAFSLPLLRCDMGKIFGSLVGESEANIRKVEQTAEAVAPCILWLDEIEKGFAGSSGGGASLDSGVGARVLGSFLTWMQEKNSPVFVYATANDVAMLPAELLRKGRFDEIFSVTLPTKAERAEIFRIHLRKLKREHLIGNGIDVEDLVEATNGWSGAEIEAVLNEGMFTAFSHKRELSMVDLSSAVSETVPLSVTMKAKIEKMMEWCKGRTRPVSHAEAAVPIIGRKVVTN
jgi:hypothetical protein